MPWRNCLRGRSSAGEAAFRLDLGVGLAPFMAAAAAVVVTAADSCELGRVARGQARRREASWGRRVCDADTREIEFARAMYD